MKGVAARDRQGVAYWPQPHCPNWWKMWKTPAYLMMPETSLIGVGLLPLPSVKFPRT